MAQATTYNLVGVREDLTDFLTILEPEDCPKTSMFAKTVRPRQQYQEWQMDTLSAPYFPGKLEGQDFTYFQNKAANRGRVGNFVQTFARTWMVSRLAEAADVAGVSNEVANAKVKAAREIKRDIEAAVGSDNEMQADNGTVPYVMRGLGKWVQSTAQSINAVPASYLTPAGSIDATATASLTENTFNGVFQSIYEVNGGKRNYMLFAGPNLKRAISKFQRATGSSGTTQSYQVIQNAKDHEISLNVEIYDGDFHHVTVVPDLFNGLTTATTEAGVFAPTNQSRARGYVIDSELVGIGYYIGMQSEEFPDQGGGRRGAVESTLTLMVKNPKGLGKFAATS